MNLSFRISRCPDLLLATVFDDVRKFGFQDVRNPMNSSDFTMSGWFDFYRI